LLLFELKGGVMRAAVRWIGQLSLSFLAATLVACGGGGGGGDAKPTPTPTPTAVATATPQPLAASSSLAGFCETPRPGNSADRVGTIDQEKAWVRSFMNETYLWYKDIPQVNPAAFTKQAYGGSTYRALDAYFASLLTPKITGSGKRVDQFSRTIPTDELNRLQSGTSSGFGIRFTFIKTTPPRILRVVYVEPGSPAELAGVLRGDTVITVDGVSVNDNTTAGLEILEAGTFPDVATKTTIFGLQAANSNTTRSVSVTSSQSVAVVPVPMTKTISIGTSTVGYLVLNSFGIDSAEKQLFDAVTQLKAANVNELVLDLRYNGGGFVDLSNQLAWMVGDASLAGKVYEKTICNDKNPFAVCNASDLFQRTTQNFSVPSGQVLPQLGLKRLFVLTSASTCSASESLMNGLSPYIQVIRIGGTTCGKPYAFFYADNCGTSYAAMHLQQQNSLGFGDYADGFSPTCQVPDDLSKQRGDPTEMMFAGALNYVRTGSCPVLSSSNSLQKQGSSASGYGNYKIVRSPVEENRWLDRPVKK
jgi:carboxyl-terminal processing protease